MSTFAATMLFEVLYHSFDLLVFGENISDIMWIIL